MRNVSTYNEEWIEKTGTSTGSHRHYYKQNYLKS